MAAELLREVDGAGGAVLAGILVVAGGLEAARGRSG